MAPEPTHTLKDPLGFANPLTSLSLSLSLFLYYHHCWRLRLRLRLGIVIIMLGFSDLVLVESMGNKQQYIQRSKLLTKNKNVILICRPNRIERERETDRKRGLLSVVGGRAIVRLRRRMRDRWLSILPVFRPNAYVVVSSFPLFYIW